VPGASTVAVRRRVSLINHYYFYLRDREYGDGFVRISSYPPCSARIWLNAHGYLAAQLRSPTLDSLDRAVRPSLVASPHRLDRTWSISRSPSTGSPRCPG
jgi:hypothetical protein